MEDTGSILSSFFKNLGMEDRLALACLQRDWAGLFDEPLSLHIYPASLNKGALVVNVDSPLWLQQLKFFKQTLLKKLEAYRINSIDFRQGNPRTFGRRNAGENTGDIAMSERELSGTDEEWIEQTVAGINDAELHDRIKIVLEKALRKTK